MYFLEQRLIWVLGHSLPNPAEQSFQLDVVVGK